MAYLQVCDLSLTLHLLEKYNFLKKSFLEQNLVKASKNPKKF